MIYFVFVLLGLLCLNIFWFGLCWYVSSFPSLNIVWFGLLLVRFQSSFFEYLLICFFLYLLSLHSLNVFLFVLCGDILRLHSLNIFWFFFFKSLFFKYPLICFVLVCFGSPFFKYLLICFVLVPFESSLFDIFWFVFLRTFGVFLLWISLDFFCSCNFWVSVL